MFACFLIAVIHFEFVTSIPPLHRDYLITLMNRNKLTFERTESDINDAREKIRAGIGGTTIVEYLNEGKTFLILDKILYNCKGTLANGQCFGELTEFNADENIEDFCFANHRIIIDDRICLSIVPIKVYQKNNVKKCEGKANRTIFIPMEKFRRKCGNSWLIRYRYTPNFSDINAISLHDCENFYLHHECIITVNESI